MEKVAIEYGDGLFELARDEKLTEELLPQALELRAILREQGAYTNIMRSRAVNKAEKDRLLKEAFEGRIHPYLYNFIRLMNDRGYFEQIPACMSRYEERCDLEHGIKRVTVRSAARLDEEQKEKIKAGVERKLGGKAVINWIVDPSLIAGLRVEANGILIENSAKYRLEDLKRHLTSAVAGK